MQSIKDSWYDEWDTERLYEGFVENCNDCAESPPILSPELEDGVVCGPILKLIEMDYGNFIFRGSVLVVTKNYECENENDMPLEYVQGPSNKEEMQGAIPSFVSERISPELFHTDQLGESVFRFYRYAMNLKLDSTYESMVRYSVNNVCKDYYRFFLPSKETNFNSIAYSCNGFSLAVDTRDFKSSLWYDVLNKHSKIHYNVMMGGGDQIYSDQIKLYCPPVKEWTETRDLVKKYGYKVDEKVLKELRAFYLTEYLNWYGFGYWKGATEHSKTTQKLFHVALASIPSINMWDDHDIIDGFGSYSDSFMSTDMFSSIGKIAYEYYMLFQHQVNSAPEKDKVLYLNDNAWILGATPGKFIKERSHSIFSRLGPDISLLSVDCRTERRLHEILTNGSYDLIFNRLENEVTKKNFLHLYVMLGVPIAYPRLVWLEWLFTSRLFRPLRWLSKKGYFMPGLVNSFNGDVELLDDLNDHWCAKHHKSERNQLISRLQDFGAKHGIRITILSGDVHLASIGRFRGTDAINKNSTEDPRLIMNIISSAITNTPPPNPMVKLLQKKNNKTHHFDDKTIEDTVPVFNHESNDKNEKRSYDCFYNNRNWSSIIPIKNAINNPYLTSKLNLELGQYVVPGKINKGFKLTQSLNHHGNSIPYEITNNGLIATIHVEKDKSNKNSKTSFYSTPIPELITKQQNLSHTGLKHLPI